MADFDKQNSALSEETLDKNAQYIYDFSQKLSTHKSGLAGGKGENATSRDIRDVVLERTGEFAHLEAFGVNRLMGKGSFLVFGIIYALALIVYFISFSGGKASQIVLTLFALVIFIAGLVLHMFMLLHKFMLQKEIGVAYNVVSEKNAENMDDSKHPKAVIIAASHSGKFGSFSLAYGKLHRIALIYIPISYVLFVLFCIIKLAVGIETVASIVTLTLLPFITTVLGIVALVTRYSIFDKRAIYNNGLASSIAFATYEYFVNHTELIPNNTKVVYVSLGGESDYMSGSKAFISAHPEYNDANVIILDNIASSDIQVNKRGCKRGSAVSLKLEESVNKIAEMQGVELVGTNTDKFEEQLDKFYGATADSFHEKEIPCVNISTIGKEDSVISITKENINKLLYLCVGTVNDCLENIKNDQLKERSNE